MDDFIADRPAYGSYSATPPPPPVAKPDGTRWAWIIAVAAIMFALGLLLNPWFEANVRDRLPGGGSSSKAAMQKLVQAQAREIASLNGRLSALERAPAKSGGDPARIVRAEAQVNALQSQVGALGVKVEGAVTEAAQDAQTAQGVMLAASARRVIDSGQPLGPLEPPLRARFGQSYPGPVEALVAAGNRPITLTRLQQDFTRVAETLRAKSAPPETWWATFMAAIGEIATVRRSGAVQINPAEVAANASARLASGDVAGAIALLSRLPPDRSLTTWLADAKRYRAAQSALAQIEAAALAPQGVMAEFDRN
jgi:hypothetical protein